MILEISPNIYSIESVLNEIGNKGKRQTFEFQTSKKSKKVTRIQKVTSPLRLFREMGTCCSHCDKISSHFSYSISKGLNLRTLDGLMTIDHTVPLSKGGNNIDNITVMCSQCNTNKGNYIIQSISKINIRSYFNYIFDTLHDTMIISNIRHMMVPIYKTKYYCNKLECDNSNIMFTFEETQDIFDLIYKKWGYKLDIENINKQFIF